MSEQTLMTDTTATTNEGEAASQQTEQTPATGADAAGQQQQPEGQSQAEGQEQQPAEKPKDEKPEGAPEQYEFKAEEGKEFDPAVVEQFAEVARELNLTQDAAQKVLDKMAPVIASRQAEQIQAVREQWATDARADKEFGGDKLDENLAVAKKAMDEFASPEMRTLLKESGLGNNPEVIRLFVRVGKAISEDGFVRGGGGHSQANDPKRLYPNSNMK